MYVDRSQLNHFNSLSRESSLSESDVVVDSLLTLRHFKEPVATLSKENERNSNLSNIENRSRKRSFTDLKCDEYDLCINLHEKGLLSKNESPSKRQKKVSFDLPVSDCVPEPEVVVAAPSRPIQNKATSMQKLLMNFNRINQQNPTAALSLLRNLYLKGMLRQGKLPNGQPAWLIVASPLSTTAGLNARAADQHGDVDSIVGSSSANSIPSLLPSSAVVHETMSPASDEESTTMDIDTQSSGADVSIEDSKATSQPNKKSNASVLLCQEFGRYFAPTNTTSMSAPPVAVEQDYGLHMRPMFTEAEIMAVAENFFGQVQADMWREELKMISATSASARAAYLTRHSQTKNPRIKVIFQLLQCSDFFYSDRGQAIAQELSLPCFIHDFEATLLRVLVPRESSYSASTPYSKAVHNKKMSVDNEEEEFEENSQVSTDSEGSNLDNNNIVTGMSTTRKIVTTKTAKQGSIRWRNQQLLLSTLPLAYFCVSHLMADHGFQLEYNLCQFLLLVSCLEARGVYHYRASNNLSLAHKSYRYMIERIGGKSYHAKPFDSCERAEKELIRTFEQTI